jgi:hypothetical protein
MRERLAGMPMIVPMDNELWRLLLLRNQASEILLRSGPSGFFLPEISIPSGQRVAVHLNSEIARLWNLEVISLFELAFPQGKSTPHHKYHVAELLEGEGLADSRFEWASLSALARKSFSGSNDFAALQHAFPNGGPPDATENEPFSKFGWFAELKDWLQDELRREGLCLTGRFRQLNAAPTFSLIRFETDRRAVWFKAVGEPNLREFPVTMVLAARFPQYTARILAARPKWNAWLTLEADGKDLFDCTDLDDWKRAALSLADLQIASIPETARILAAGARDMRLPVLLARSGSFFDLMNRLMRQQLKATPPPLNRDDLQRLQESFEEILRALSESKVAEALVHLDFNPGNILVSSDRCTFLDWAEAAIGPPFLTFAYLREHFRRVFPESLAAEAELETAYTACWQSQFEAADVRNVMKLTPIVAAFAYAITMTAGLEMERIEQPAIAATLRSLTRRMHREIACWRTRSGAAQRGSPGRSSRKGKVECFN